VRAVTAAGIDAGAITFEGQSARLRAIVEQCDLIGLNPACLADDHRPVKAREATICHGDFHPLTSFRQEQTTGVIDGPNAVIAEPAIGCRFSDRQHVRRSTPSGHGRARCGPPRYRRGTEAL